MYHTQKKYKAIIKYRGAGHPKYVLIIPLFLHYISLSFGMLKDWKLMLHILSAIDSTHISVFWNHFKRPKIFLKPFFHIISVQNSQCRNNFPKWIISYFGTFLVYKSLLISHWETKISFYPKINSNFLFCDFQKPKFCRFLYTEDKNNDPDGIWLIYGLKPKWTQKEIFKE